jgi:hypothetical protein
MILFNIRGGKNMTHVDDQSHDFEDLDGLNEDVREVIKLARIEARTIIDSLEPRHLSGYPTLILLLEEALDIAKRNFDLAMEHKRIKCLEKSREETPA